MNSKRNPNAGIEYSDIVYDYDIPNYPYNTSNCSHVSISETSTMSPEDKIKLLENRITQLEHSLDRCTEIVNNLQDNVCAYMGYIDRTVGETHYQLKRHICSTHAMLIIGNKEGKNECDIS